MSWVQGYKKPKDINRKISYITQKRSKYRRVLWCTRLTMVHHTPDFTHIRQMWLNALLDVAKPIWKDYCTRILSFCQTHPCSRLVHAISGVVHLQALRRTLPQPTMMTCRQHSSTRCHISATPLSKEPSSSALRRLLAKAQPVLR